MTQKEESLVDQQQAYSDHEGIVRLLLFTFSYLVAMSTDYIKHFKDT